MATCPAATENEYVRPDLSTFDLPVEYTVRERGKSRNGKPIILIVFNSSARTADNGIMTTWCYIDNKHFWEKYNRWRKGAEDTCWFMGRHGVVDVRAVCMQLYIDGSGDLQVAMKVVKPGIGDSLRDLEAPKIVEESPERVPRDRDKVNC